MEIATFASETLPEIATFPDICLLPASRLTIGEIVREMADTQPFPRQTDWGEVSEPVIATAARLWRSLRYVPESGLCRETLYSLSIATKADVSRAMSMLLTCYSH